MTKRRGAGKIRKQRPGPRRNTRKGAESTNAGIRETVEELVGKSRGTPPFSGAFRRTLSGRRNSCRARTFPAAGFSPWCPA